LTEVRCGKSLGRGRVCGKLLGVVGPEGWEDREGRVAADDGTVLFTKGALLTECPRHGWRKLLKAERIGAPTVFV